MSVPGSMLASRFSGRWDDGLEKDKHGNFFIDKNALSSKSCFTTSGTRKTGSKNIQLYHLIMALEEPISVEWLIITE